MSEILDFIIEIIGALNDFKRSYKKEFKKAVNMNPDEQKIVTDCFKEHISKDPITANMSYSYLYVILRKKNMKVVALDDRLNKMFSVSFKARFTAEWKTGRTKKYIFS